jgi:hypothetical protein
MLTVSVIVGGVSARHGPVMSVRLRSALGGCCHPGATAPRREVASTSEVTSGDGEGLRCHRVLQNCPKSRASITNVISDIVDTFGHVSDVALAAVVMDATSASPYFPRHAQLPCPALDQPLPPPCDHISACGQSAATHIEASGLHSTAPSMASSHHQVPPHQSVPLAIVPSIILDENGRSPGSRLYVCECLLCRLRGASAVETFLAAEKVPFQTVSWLGWCASSLNGPAALVKHTGDANVYSMLDLSATDARLKQVWRVKDASFATGVTRRYEALSMQRFTPNAPTLMKNVTWTPSQAAEFATTKQCPVSTKAWQMDPDAIVEEIKRAALRSGGGGLAHEHWAAVRKQPDQGEGGKLVVIYNDDGFTTAFADHYLLTDPGARMRMLVGAAIGAHVVGAGRVVMYLRYEYKNVRPLLLQAFQMYRTQLNMKAAALSFDVILGDCPYVMQASLSTSAITGQQACNSMLVGTPAGPVCCRVRLALALGDSFCVWRDQHDGSALGERVPESVSRLYGSQGARPVPSGAGRRHGSEDALARGARQS